MDAAVAPLEDPAYEPRYPPENGRPPAIVAKWGPKSQLRWFRRFWPDMGVLPTEVVRGFYCHSTEHLGPCCTGCISDEEYTGESTFDDHCCCEGYKAAKASPAP